MFKMYHLYNNCTKSVHFFIVNFEEQKNFKSRFRQKINFSIFFSSLKKWIFDYFSKNIVRNRKKKVKCAHIKIWIKTPKICKFMPRNVVNIHSSGQSTKKNLNEHKNPIHNHSVNSHLRIDLHNILLPTYLYIYIYIFISFIDVSSKIENRYCMSNIKRRLYLYS